MTRPTPATLDTIDARRCRGTSSSSRPAPDNPSTVLATEDICPYTGVSFAEAVTVLGDDLALTREDAADGEEQRFVTLGLSDSANLLVVVYVYREPDIIRIVSAWKASRRQKDLYEEGRS
jgi:uncharacterized protein